MKPWVFPVAGVVLLLCLPRLDAPGRLYAWILGLTLAVHLAAFYLAGLLLPRERTGLFLIPLVTLLAGAAARVERRVMPGVLCLFAVLYLVCLRTSYFREWRWNASVGEAYAVVHRWEQHGCARETGAGWRYVLLAGRVPAHARRGGPGGVRGCYEIRTPAGPLYPPPGV